MVQPLEALPLPCVVLTASPHEHLQADHRFQDIGEAFSGETGPSHENASVRQRRALSVVVEL